MNKKNADIFKGFKQFNYLCIISVYNLTILVINLLSWTSNCNLTYGILCPESRKLIAIQFFKVIFREIIGFALRFMINFAYVAFAFNRIALIGRDHPKLVKFLAETKIKWYVFVTTLISLALSVVKGFKYRVNYHYSEMNYPYNFDRDFWYHKTSGAVVYLFFNMICDILNYNVFVLVNMSIDIYMLVRLQQTLEEKSKKFENSKI